MTSTPPNISPSTEKPSEEPAPVREFAGIPVLDSDEDEKKASLHNPEPERESPATPGGDPLRVENGGTPAGTFSFHRHRFLTIREDGKLRDLGCDVPVDGGVCGLTFEEAMEQAFCRWHYSHRREGAV